MPSNQPAESAELHSAEQVESVLNAAPAERDGETLVSLRSALQAQQAENKRLREELSLRDRALDAAPSHFVISKYISEGESTIIYANRAIAQSHGYAPEDMVGMSVKTISPANWTPERYKQVRTLLSQGKEARVEGEVRRRDGSTFWAGITIVPITDGEGRLTHTMSIASDITLRLEDERKKRELQDRLYNEMQERERILIELRLAQKLESVGRLAAGIAHEINTPIQYVGDSLHFLRAAFDDLKKLIEAHRGVESALAGSDPAHGALAALRDTVAALDLEFLESEIPKAFDRTFEGAERVTHIVRAMKEFSHPDATAFSSADLNHALETTLTVATNEYKYLASVRTRFAELPLVTCNVGELNQVFLNLIVNAAHAIHDAGKDVTTGEIVVGTALAGDSVEIIIGDNGCGISQENLDKIYDPFFTTKEVGRGTGQGLAIARSIVIDKHGGDIRVKSTLGVGTQFIVSLPIAGYSKSAEALSTARMPAHTVQK